VNIAVVLLFAAGVLRLTARLAGVRNFSAFATALIPTLRWDAATPR
jgi:hypothetical protein